VSLHAHSLPLRLAASLGLIALAHRWALDSPFNVEKVEKERENMTRVSRKRTGDSFVEPGLSLARPIRPEGKKRKGQVTSPGRSKMNPDPGLGMGLVRGRSLCTGFGPNFTHWVNSNLFFYFICFNILCSIYNSYLLIR
jgi:hypothetical protein